MHKTLSLVFVLTLLSAATTSQVVHFVRIHQDGKTKGCIFLLQETLRKYKGFRSPNDKVSITTRPAIVPHPDDGEGGEAVPQDQLSKIIGIYARTKDALNSQISKICKSITHPPIPPKPRLRGKISPEDIRKIVDSGNQTNRIDVVFMGDGYTVSERDRFFKDIERLTNEMFMGVTFRSFLPLFNIWAIFTPSKESGIGYNSPKDTAFRLHRRSGRLRDIFTENPDYAREVCLLTGEGGCDYPALIGNDDFYGGLGGEFLISTRSERSGTVVLRHEMGHNFADVGEEYDGGQLYYGVNAAASLTSVGWKAWLSNPSALREERATVLLQSYPWEDLSKGEVTLRFSSDGTYFRWSLIISLTGAKEPDSVEILIDGVPLNWTSKGSDDREFYEWVESSGFLIGPHKLLIRSKTIPSNPNIKRMLASVNLQEWGEEGSEFNSGNNHISAYPTFNPGMVKTYRPTNTGCLMRRMTFDRLCPICNEGIWSKFLSRISLIDDIAIVNGNLTLRTLQLGQLRAPGNQVLKERLKIRWSHEGIEKPKLNDIFQFPINDGENTGWEVTVKFITSEVREDPDNLLTDSRKFPANSAQETAAMTFINIVIGPMYMAMINFMMMQ